MFYPGNWIHSFPQHFQWSNATLIAKGMAPYAAVALEEIDRVVQRLHQRISEPHAWWEEWGAVAAQVERAADAAAAQGRDATAGNYYLRAGNYYYTGERMLPPGAQKLEMYRKSLRCSHEGLKRRYPTLEIIDVPYEGTALPAYFMKSPTAKRRAPTVVLFDGLDNCKEMSVLFAGVELAFRGFHTLAIDGPGQGEALRLRDLPSRYDYEVPGKAAYEYVASRADVDPERVAIMAYSAGGYYAPRAAAFEKRYAACVAWGPHYDYHAVWQKRWDAMQKDEKANATSHFQLPWVLGVADMETAMEKLKKFTLEGVAQLITCPMLICWGEQDKLTPREVARKLHDSVGSKDKTLKIFTVKEGGAEHCQVDNRQIATDYIADWLEARLR
ncbi:MAG TPA: alpha/beta fold hydrolase [Burkholderiales bacterium]|jgi:alpha-beta hydrolase superfamily lysophospholipase|nr:alpha/beta fold hydrolase [Burkholderiales bacterium]